MSVYSIKKNKLLIPKIYLWVLFAAFIANISSVFAQSKKDLENKKKKILNELKDANELLSKTRKDKNASLNDVVALNIKIKKRQELIATINSQMNLLAKEVKKTNTSIIESQNELAKLKQDYAKMIYFAYMNQDAYTRLMYVFASKDFNQAYLRLKYFQQYSEYRKKQADMIVTTQKKLTSQKENLEKQKEEKAVLLGSQNAEKETLTKEKSDKETVVAQLRSKEQELKKDIEKKKADAEKLQQAIKEIIAASIKAANEKALKEKKASDPIPSSPKVNLMTHGDKELSNDFEKNQGKLPWPVIKSIVTEHFGPHTHPLMDIIVHNNGIDISTSKGALVRAVFNGEVTGVATVPGSGKVLIIRHGEYLSVYSNLNEIFVKQGDKITTKQNIGTIIYDESESKTEMHLEIWKGQIKLDPEAWLSKN